MIKFITDHGDIILIVLWVATVAWTVDAAIFYIKTLKD